MTDATPVAEMNDRPSVGSRCLSAFGWLLLTAIAAAAIFYGLQVRHYAWTATQGSHFRGDIAAGWGWGNRALDQGLFTFYDDLAYDFPREPRRWNDYPPLRLSIMTAWAHWTRAHYPDARAWQDDYDFTLPVLTANTTAELLASVLVFPIIVILKIRMANAAAARGPQPPRHRRNRYLRAATAGLFGALLFWFNPAVIWDGHAWPQWDVWLMPLFLAAVLAAILECWFMAGVCVVIGAFLKGQMLLGAPVLLLMPLFRGQFGAVLRLICGLIFGTAVLAAPWMQLTPAAWKWVGCVTAAILILRLFDALARRRAYRIRALPDAATDVADPAAQPAIYQVGGIRSRLPGTPMGWSRTALVALALLALCWPWTSRVPFTLLLLGWLPLAIAAVAGGMHRSLRWPMTAAAIGLAVLLTMPLLRSGTGWYTMGFVNGAEKFEHMFTGSGSWNVPAMLMEYMEWSRDPQQPVVAPGFNAPEVLSNALTRYYAKSDRLFDWNTRISATDFLRRLYVIAIILCGIGAAIQAKRRDTRLLVALVAPWLAAFMLLTQMHGRYSIWAAGFAALLAGESVGLALLGLLVSTVAMLGIVENQFLWVPDFAPNTLSQLRRLDPHLGWVYLVVLAILMYVALVPRRRDTFAVMKPLLKSPALTPSSIPPESQSSLVPPSA